MTTPSDARPAARPYSAANLMASMEELGLTQRDLAALAGVDERTARRWVQGRTGSRANRVPASVGARLDAVVAASAMLRDELARVAVRDGVLTVWRDDDAFWAAHPEHRPLPARWWRHQAIRAARRTGVRLRFVDDPIDG